MKKILLISLLFCHTFLIAQTNKSSFSDLQWGNAFYYNLNCGESILFDSTEIKLIQLQNHYNQLKVGEDTLWLKVSRRTLPQIVGKLRIFVADNKNVKGLTEDQVTHGLLTKDALVCVSYSGIPLLDQKNFVFPVSFNDGFVWQGEEENHIFSYLGFQQCKEAKKYRSFEGVEFDLHDAKGLEKHWLVAIESSTVVWINENNESDNIRQVTVLLQSHSNPQIFYLYDKLYKRNLEVREGQNLIRGELIGTAWGDEKRCYVLFSVISSDTVPSLLPCDFQVVNFFPQLHELYFRNSPQFSRSFEKGTIRFGRDTEKFGSGKNNLAFEEYSGKGWLLGRWNTADKVETAEKGDAGNVRLNRILFADTPAECRNPNNWFDYEINVRNGTYRIRAKTGDLLVPTWQKITFEEVNAGTYQLNKGEFKWSSERIIKVTDGKLTIRIYVDEAGNTSAGISEIVFQRVN